MSVCKILCCVVGLALSFACTFSLAKSDLKQIDRSIKKEPHYENAPQYVLLALGDEAPTLMWLVEDGRKLYIDKNANGDLTDDGLPLEPTNERSFGRVAEGKTQESWDFDYKLDRFEPQTRPPQTAFTMHRWNYGSANDEYGIELTLDGKIPMYAGWVPIWAKSPAKAKIINFGGALKPHTLRFKKFVVDGKMDRLSFAYMNHGLGKGADARLSIEALPPDVMPEVLIHWPTKAGNPPRETKYVLDHRCCYWEYYLLDFEMPKGVVAGTAKATLKLPKDALQIPLATDTIEIPVVDAEEPSPGKTAAP